MKDGIDDLLAVNGVANSLTNLQIIGGTIRIDQIEEVVEAGHGRPCILDQIGVGVNLVYVVGLNGVGNVDLAHFQSDDALCGLRDDLHDKVLGRGLAHEVLVKCLELDRFGRVPFDHLVRTGADGMLREIFIAVGLDVGLWHDGGEWHRKVIQDRSVRLCAVNDNGVLTGDLHTLDKADDVVDIVGGDRTIKRPLDVLNSQVASIVELDALTDGKLPILVVELLIALSKQRLGFAVTDDFHQRAENVARDRNGGSFLADVRVH